MSSLSIFILLFLSCSLAQNNTLLYQCMQFPINNKLCFSVSSNDCLQLTGSVTWNSEDIVSPQRIPLDRILSIYQRRLRDPSYTDGSKKLTVCQPLVIPGGQDCNACNTISDILIEGDNLHYCGSLSVNCTILGIKQERTLYLPNPCVDLRDCKNYGCQNNCSNNGRCTSVGLCRCSPGSYGFDCSTQIQNNCISSPIIPKSCWKFNFPDCNTVVYKVTTPAGEVQQKATLDSGSTLNLVPCQKLNYNNVNCEMCVDVKDLRKDVDKLIGCPSLIISCGGREVANTPLDCIQLAKSPALVCPNSEGASGEVNGTISMMGNQSTAKTILIAMAGILGVALLGAGGYLVMTKVFGFDGATPFQKIETYLEDDEPLNGKSNIQEKGAELLEEDLEEDSV